MNIQGQFTSDEERAARRLIEQAGTILKGLRGDMPESFAPLMFAGVSSGAVVHVARRIADELPEGAVVVAVLADGGWKYLSAPFWSGEEIDEAVLWW